MLMLQAVLLVMKTRYDRYRLLMTPLYRFDNNQVRRGTCTCSGYCFVLK